MAVGLRHPARVSWRRARAAAHYTDSMHLDQTLLSISVATVQLRSEGAGTRQSSPGSGAYLDGHDFGLA